MTRETKVGLLVGLGMILLIGIIVSDHLSVVSQQEAFSPTHFAEQAQRSLHGTTTPAPGTAPGMVAAPGSPAGATGAVPGTSQGQASASGGPGDSTLQQPVPLAEELRRAPQDAVTTDLTGEPPPRQTYPMRAYALDTRDPRTSVQDMVTRPSQAQEPTDAPPSHDPVGADPRLALLGQPGDFVAVRHELDRSPPAREAAALPGSETLRFHETVPAPREQMVRPAAASATAPTTEALTYTVKPGDSLSKIAREQLGSDSRWRDIFELNRDKVDSPESLQAGMVIRLPRSNAPAASGASGNNREAAPPTGTSTATRTAAVPMPVVLDPAATPPQRLQDLRAAQRQSRGEATATAAAPARTSRTYVVQRGDTLTKIAEKTLGDGSQWRKLYQANKARIADPDAVPVGLELTIPQS